jgi:transposase
LKAVGFSQKGRPPQDNRQFLQALIYLARKGCRWRDLPADKFGFWKTIYNRFARYSKRGVWKKMLELCKGKTRCKLRALDATFIRTALCALVGQCGKAQRLVGRTKGGWTSKCTMIVDMEGRVHDLRLDPGNCADINAGFELIYDQEFIQLLADKGYDSAEFRQVLENLGCDHNIPQRSNAKEKLPFDKELYKKRHIVENIFAKAQWWDRIRVRRERRGDHATAFITLFAIGTWVN